MLHFQQTSWCFNIIFNKMKPSTICIGLLVLFMFNLLWLQPCEATSSIGNDTDQFSLLKFKESVFKDPHNILASWNGSVHFCRWQGISCSHRHQRVTELILGGYELDGLISPHIGNLSFLRVLNLKNNSFHGGIPPEIGRLFRLQVLEFSNNTLTGKFPINVTSCSHLWYLSFGGNNLSGKIPMEIGNFHKLEMLYVLENNFVGQIPVSMCNLSSLRLISMKDNHLEGNVPGEIGHLRNLTRLYLGVNKLSGAIPSSLYNLSSLNKLSLAFNKISGSLPTNMFLTLPNLLHLQIEGNQFLGPIPTSIMNASIMLQDIEFAQNNFVGQVPNLGNLRDLSHLLLFDNYLGSNSSKDSEFLTSLTNCTKLGRLDIGINSFGGRVPEIIGNLSTQLITLLIDNNNFYGKIPATLGDLSNLQVLSMANNHFTDVIPTNFVKLQKIQKVELSMNKLSGEIEPFIGNLTQLFHLDLSQNRLEGHIPPSIENCKSLQYLDLSQNNFFGGIPEEIFELSALSILLNLSHNSFSRLAGNVGKLKNLGKLDISQNHLFGQIPKTIGDCASLEYLFLQGNSFQEAIPSSLSSLKGLRYLDLSLNNLSGSIPKGLQDIRTLGYLNISFNMLEGEVPKKGVFGNASSISVSGNTKLCGGISELKLPPCSNTHHKIKLVVVVCCVASFLLLLSSSVAFYCMRKRSKKSSPNTPTIDQLPKFSYQCLHNATNGFSINNLIGSGSFGTVYKGILESQEAVAIKVFNLQTKGARKSFVAECNALRNIRHRNLVKIITCCSSTDYRGHDFKALVYEFLVNGSLEKLLHPDANNEDDHPRPLLLGQIIDIVNDVASSLCYLHHECEQPIIHCDLKPSNVLLDGDMVAHVSDFGLARLLPTVKGTSNQQSSTIGIKGTIGYVPTEYGMGSELSIQGDLYSFGILVLEILSGRRPTDDIFKDGHNLHNHVEAALSPNMISQIVNPSILIGGSEDTVVASLQTGQDPNLEKCLYSLFKIGLACSMESPNDRMSMVDATRELNMIKKSLLFGSSFNIVKKIGE